MGRRSRNQINHDWEDYSNDYDPREKRRRSRDLRHHRHDSSYSDSSESLTPEAHTEFQHEEFVDKVQETRNSQRWANRRTSLQKRAKNGGGHKPASRVNKETEEEENMLRQRKRKEEEYAKRRQEREEHERRKRERERYNREQSRERLTHESTYSGRSDYFTRYEAQNEVITADLQLLRQHSEPAYYDFDQYEEEFTRQKPKRASRRRGSRRPQDVEEKGACECVIL